MINRSILIAGILFTSLLLGGGTGGPDTYVRFQVEGQTHEVQGLIFTVTRMDENVHFMDLNYVPRPLVPGAIVQWRMRLDSLKQLVGKNLHLKTVDPNHVNPVAIFRITQDLSARSNKHSNVHFRIDRIKGDFIEGSFSGKDLLYVSRAKKVARKVDVTARFRAKLVKKHWNTEVRSRKRSAK